MEEKLTRGEIGEQKTCARPSVNYPLSPTKLEMFAILAEELGEVQHMVGKIMRHGLDSYNPHDPEMTSNNKLLEKELGDLQWIINRLCFHGCIKKENINAHMTLRGDSIIKYTHNII